jgi:hypothetical protein
MVHIHGGTVTLPREVRITSEDEGGESADHGRTGSAFAPNFSKQKSRSVS